METLTNLTTTQKVKALIELGFKKNAIAKKVGLSRPAFDARLKDNSWKDSERIALKELGIS